MSLVGAVAVAQELPDRGGRSAYQDFALDHQGDPARGKILFEKNKQLACADCHRITGMEKSGPNLDGIGEKYPRTELIRQILQPSESIKPGYEQASVITRQGRILTGRFERSTKLGVRLIDTKGKQINLKSKDIERIQHSTQSLMPDNLVTSISKQQFADLVAYLQTLRFGVKTGLAAGGQVVPIPRLAKPIHFTPIHPKRVTFENPVWCGAIPGAP